MLPKLMIVVFWCLPSAPISSFDPHVLNAAQKFVAANPATCGQDFPEEIDGPETVAQCRSGALLNYMPSWIQRNPGKLYMTADCFERSFEPLDLEAMKRKVSP